MTTTAITPDHPDTITDYATFKAIQRGSKQAIEDQAIAAYMRAYEEQGKEEAEKVFFSFFNKQNNGSDSNSMEGNKRRFTSEAWQGKL